MHPDKRREGRRIRKQRRKWEKISKAFMKMSEPKVWEDAKRSIEEFSRVIQQLTPRKED